MTLRARKVSGPFEKRAPGAICGLSLLLVLALLQGFFSEFSGFPPSTETNISKFQFDQDRGSASSSLNIVIYLFIYFI